MTPFQLAQKSLLRRRLSTGLAVVSIALAVACCGVLLRLYLLMNQRFATMGRGGDAIVGAKAGGIDILLGALNSEGRYPEFLPYRLFETLRAQQGVRFEDGAKSEPDYLRSTIPFLFFGKYFQFRAVGTDETFFSRPSAEDSMEFQSGHAAESATEIALGSSVADQKQLKVGDEVVIRPWVSDENLPTGDGTLGAFVKLKVSGILKPTHTMWDRLLYATVPMAQSVVATSPGLSERSIWGSNVLNYFLIYLKPRGFQPLKDLINKRTVGQSIFVLHEKKNLEEITGTGQAVGLFVSALVILLGGLSVASMLVTRFDAMGTQLAVLRAIGYKKSEVAQALLLEGVLLGVAACLFGAALDFVLFPAVRAVLASSLPPPDLIDEPLWASAPVWLAALTATVASVFFPLFKLYRQDVHRSLQ